MSRPPGLISWMGLGGGRVGRALGGLDEGQDEATLFRRQGVQADDPGRMSRPSDASAERAGADLGRILGRRYQNAGLRPYASAPAWMPAGAGSFDVF